VQFAFMAIEEPQKMGENSPIFESIYMQNTPIQA